MRMTIHWSYQNDGSNVQNSDDELRSDCRWDILVQARVGQHEGCTSMGDYYPWGAGCHSVDLIGRIRYTCNLVMNKLLEYLPPVLMIAIIAIAWIGLIVFAVSLLWS